MPRYPTSLWTQQYAWDIRLHNIRILLALKLNIRIFWSATGTLKIPVSYKICTFLWVGFQCWLCIPLGFHALLCFYLQWSCSCTHFQTNPTPVRVSECTSGLLHTFTSLNEAFCIVALYWKNKVVYYWIDNGSTWFHVLSLRSPNTRIKLLNTKRGYKMRGGACLGGGRIKE